MFSGDDSTNTVGVDVIEQAFGRVAYYTFAHADATLRFYSRSGWNLEKLRDRSA